MCNPADKPETNAGVLQIEVTPDAISRVASVLMGDSHFRLTQVSAASLAEEILYAAASPGCGPARIPATSVSVREIRPLFFEEFRRKEP